MHRHAHPAPQGHGGPSRFLLALLITLGFACIELLGGLWSGSLALMGDAGHMATDAIALGIASTAAWLAKRPASARHSFGFGRMEVLAALINTLCMLAIVVGLVIEAILRLSDPEPVKAPWVMLIAAAGLVLNVTLYRLLQHGAPTLNLRAALLHVASDALGSVAALAAGAIVWLTGWLPADPLLSLLIGLLILVSSVRLLRDAGHMLLEGVPAGLDLGEIGRGMAGVDGVTSVHDLHIWSLSSSEVALSAHVVVEHLEDWQIILTRLETYLHDTHHIPHTTLQPESTVLARVALTSVGRRK